MYWIFRFFYFTRVRFKLRRKKYVRTLTAVMHYNQFIFTRERRRFGQQCLFSDRTQLMLSINPNMKLRRNYILRNPVHTGTQLSDQKALSTALTENVTYIEHGMYHCEGGWPKEVNINDEESTLRYRKKIEREDAWGQQVIRLIASTTEAIEQNNAVNIYQEFFVDLPAEICEQIRLDFEARQKNIFHDPYTPHRPTSVIDWTPNDVKRFLVLHTNIPLNRLEAIERRKAPRPDMVKFKGRMVSKDGNSFYIWDLENPLKPMVNFTSIEIVRKALFCPKDENWIAGGLNSGEVCVWDVRTGGDRISICPLEAAHREPTSAICWVHSKTNTEFYTGSLDSSVKYWDGRDMEKPIQEILLDPVLTDSQSRSRSHGVTVLEFEYTIPVRFIIGSDMGSIFVGNRKGMTPSETLAAGNYRLFSGPIRTIERNPFFVKNFLITGDWCARIWAEECKGSPTTLVVKKKNEIFCGTWSTARCSLFVTGDARGELDFWDLLLHQRKPIFTLKFSHAIVYAKFRSDGEYLAVGLSNGDIHVLEMDPALKRCTTKDKALTTAMFEREQLRCKLLDARLEEIKMKRKTEAADESELVYTQKDENIANLDDPEEFLRIMAKDTEFKEVFTTFQDQVYKVDKNRQEREYVMDRTDFEPEL
uniref:WD_REPEATS_REGION domain-containing protein n=1 Tax=Glossina brevipalpis TaxID=37001 RepID=A0A1A9WBA0_9MUSC